MIKEITMTIKKVVYMKKYDETSLAAAQRIYAFCTKDKNWYIVTRLTVTSVDYGYYTYPLFAHPTETKHYFKKGTIIDKEELLDKCKVYDVDTLEDLIELLQTTQEIN